MDLARNPTNRMYGEAILGVTDIVLANLRHISELTTDFILSNLDTEPDESMDTEGTFGLDHDDSFESFSKQKEYFASVITAYTSGSGSPAATTRMMGNSSTTNEFVRKFQALSRMWNGIHGPILAATEENYLEIYTDKLHSFRRQVRDLETEYAARVNYVPQTSCVYER